MGWRSRDSVANIQSLSHQTSHIPRILSSPVTLEICHCALLLLSGRNLLSVNFENREAGGM